MTSQFGRMDIVLLNPLLGFLCLIENKIDAYEQEHQLERYGQWMYSHRQDFPKRALIYLTPYGSAAGTAGNYLYYRLSYRQDIAKWLEEFFRKYRHLVLQGCETVFGNCRTVIASTFLAWRKMMSIEEPVFDFLTQPDNLTVALEVAAQVEQLKHRMHQAFWSEFNPRMDLKVKQSEYAQAWQYHLHPANSYRKGWGKSYIAPKTTGNTSIPHLQLAFGQSTSQSDFRLYWGVNWNTQPPKDFNHPALVTLTALLINRNITTIEVPMWIRWGSTKYIPYSADFLSRMYREPRCFSM